MKGLFRQREDLQGKAVPERRIRDGMEMAALSMIQEVNRRQPYDRGKCQRYAAPEMGVVRLLGTTMEDYKCGTRKRKWGKHCADTRRWFCALRGQMVGAWAPGNRPGEVRVWDVEKGEAVGDTLEGHSNFVLCVAWSDDNRRMPSAGHDETVRVLDVESGKCILTEDGRKYMRNPD